MGDVEERFAGRFGACLPRGCGRFYFSEAVPRICIDRSDPLLELFCWAVRLIKAGTRVFGFWRRWLVSGHVWLAKYIGILVA
jgi:hypothetical protein